MDSRIDRPPLFRSVVISPLLLGVALLAVAVPVLFTGPGSDLDTGAVFESGASILDGDYVASRAPGAPVHEAAVGVLEAIGGTALTNLGSLLMATVLVLSLVALLRHEGVPHPELPTALVVANPWFQVAASSTVDFVWAMGFAVTGALAMRLGRVVPAGLLFALAIGSRMSTVVVVAAALLAQVLEPGAAHRRRPTLVTALVAGIGTILLFLPSYFAAGSSLAFANNDFATSTPLNHVGRALAKNLYFFGPYLAVALLALVPLVLRGARVWRTSWPLRFGLLGLVASQALFLRFPWKMGHLIPTLVFVAIVLAVTLASRPRLLMAVVALQLVFCVVNVELFRPDRPNEATSAAFEIDVRWGPSIVDTQCRRQDPDAWIGNDRARLEAVWNCAKPWGEGP